MRISIRSDHLGYQFKAALVPLLEHWENKAIDEGSDHAVPIGYPDFAYKVSEKV